MEVLLGSHDSLREIMAGEINEGTVRTVLTVLKPVLPQHLILTLNADCFLLTSKKTSSFQCVCVCVLGPRCEAASRNFWVHYDRNEVALFYKPR